MKYKSTTFLFLLLVCFSLPVLAEIEDDEFEDDDIEVFGIELEDLLNLGSSILAIVLFVLTFMAYRRTNRSRLAYISTAFLLFAIKGILDSLELFFNEWAWIDPITSILDFVILLIFFIGVLKKEK